MFSNVGLMFEEWRAERRERRAGNLGFRDQKLSLPDHEKSFTGMQGIGVGDCSFHGKCYNVFV
jgi:hypothetical protein